MKKIGSLKRDDESLAVDDNEKANLLNCFFSTVGMKLTDTIKPRHHALTATKSKPVPCIYDARVSYGEVAKKRLHFEDKSDGISDLFRHGYLELLEHLLLCR